MTESDEILSEIYEVGESIEEVVKRILVFTKSKIHGKRLEAKDIEYIENYICMLNDLSEILAKLTGELKCL